MSGGARHQAWLGALEADRAVDKIRERFGWQAIGYGSVALEYLAPCPMNFASWLKRTFELVPGNRDEAISGQERAWQRDCSLLSQIRNSLIAILS